MQYALRRLYCPSYLNIRVFADKRLDGTRSLNIKKTTYPQRSREQIWNIFIFIFYFAQQ